jgi:hypothetical protein
LFFLGTDGTLMSVAIIGDAAAFHKGEPQPLFQTRLSGLPEPLRSFAVAPGGQQFLLSEPDNPDPGRSIVVASHWQTLLKPVNENLR